MDFIRLNVALKVPNEIAERAIVLSKKIATDNKPMFVLDDIGSHPHITIYPPEYPNQEVKNVLSSVEKIANETKQVSAKFSLPKNLRDFVAIPVRLSTDIMELHKRVINTLNPLRNGHIKEGYEDYAGFSPEQHNNIQKYGYPYVMTLYNPHLTIIRFEDEETAKSMADSLQWDIDEFTVEKLTVYTMGENGTCKELLGEFPLKN